MTRACLVRWCVSVVCLAGLATDAAAQTVTDERVWFNLTLQDGGGTASPWHWTMETIVRSRDGVETLDQFALRPIVMYNLTAHSSVGGGYLIGRSEPAVGPILVEHRIAGQYMWRGPVRGGTLTLRTRLEERFIVVDNDPVTRLRQQVRFSYPIAQGSRIAVVGYDEVFVNLEGSTRYKRGLDHNRAFAGISDTLSKRYRVEVGYLNQFIPGHGGLDRMNHVLSGALAVSF